MRGEAVIACNRAHESLPQASYVACFDFYIFLNHEQFASKLRPHGCRHVFTTEGGAAIHPRAVELRWGGREGYVSDGFGEPFHAANTGMAAVNIAYCLGYNPIYLLGMDCKADYSEHWDGDAHFYDDPWRRAVMRDYTEEFMEGWRRRLDGQAAQYAYRDVEVINLGPDSALREYRRGNWETALNRH